MAGPADGSTERLKPALRFDVLTGLFDPVVKVASRERAFKQRVLERARIAPGEAVLDLACGTGTLALMAWRQQPAAAMTALDGDPAILERARAKAAAAPIAFDEGLSTALPYADASFDAVLTTLFFHHLDDGSKRATACEIARVLRPGGRLVVADYGCGQDPAMRLAFAVTVRTLDGRATTALNAAGGLPRLLADNGLVDVRTTDRLRTPTGTIDVIVGRRDRMDD